MMLISGFITEVEADFLVRLAYLSAPRKNANLSRTPLFKKSTVIDQTKAHALEKDTRDSLSAYLKMPSKSTMDDDDVVVNCIERRAAQFQGYVPVDNLETLRVVKSFHPT